MAYGTLNIDNLTSSDGGVISPNINSLRNRIINGAMVIDQRNAGAAVTPASGDYTLDRWVYFATQASKFSVQQNKGSVTTPVGFTNYLGMSVSSAVSVGSGDSFSLRQKIEGFNFADFQWGTANAKTVTLSFQVYSSLTGTFGGVLQNSANNRSYPFTYTISSANTWTSASITIAGDTTGTWVGATNGIGLNVNFGLGQGATYSGTAGAWAGAEYYNATGATSVVGTNGATFYITGVQLEKGSTATSFDYRPYSVELSLCERYYEVCNSNAGDGIALASGFYASSTNCRAIQTFHTKKRATPTIALGSGASWGGAAGTPTINAGVDVVSYSAANYFVAYNGSGGVALTASAEL
jgi:hypothetical protein